MSSSGVVEAMAHFTRLTASQYESSPLQSSVLVSERMAFKLHRQGTNYGSIGKDKAVCYEYPSPIIRKNAGAIRW
ncbi:TraU family protein [Klebsiella pneumoniae]|uniref:TraU family protein n=1 Tax=Klebsiella pneumoniae TaxID=573 RepID=A0A939NTR8_KLEPN|nr:TraU family protein [Klebsiella pneumoniae]